MYRVSNSIKMLFKFISYLTGKELETVNTNSGNVGNAISNEYPFNFK